MLCSRHPGISAVWLARLAGGQEVAGSNPVFPIYTQTAFRIVFNDT